MKVLMGFRQVVLAAVAAMGMTAFGESPADVKSSFVFDFGGRKP